KDKEINELYDPTPYDFVKVYRFPNIEVPTDNALTIAKVQLGRSLFYDASLSLSGNTSCATCHNQDFGFTDHELDLSTNDLGNFTSRNASSLFNLVWTDKGFFWDGRASSLELAVEDAINNEQHPEWDVTLANIQADPSYKTSFETAFEYGEVSRDNINKALASFIRTIVSQNAKFDLVTRAQATLTPLEQYGFDSIFVTEKGDCFHCHGVYPFMTDNDFHDNGLQGNGYADLGLGGFNGNAFDQGKMKTPPLRNLSYTAPYMHDGRFASLDEVIDFYSEGVNLTPNIDPLMKKAHQGGLQLSAYEKEALKAFLLTLDDPVFRSNVDYSSPF
ncbi:MAG: cytochrome-c peroxidase, partial [Bacteroidetes bacterium]|nr:cytochrome-c peroxidase [Bacteroidota bacterium]